MPLFGKKNNQPKEKDPALMQKGSYPTNQGGYPPQASYPPQGAYPYQGPHQQIGPHGAEPPPPYSYAPPPAQGQGPPYSYMPPQAHRPPPQTVIVEGGYDAGARFDGVAQRNVPPPPPGCMPNTAQMASQQGQNVVLTQKSAGFWTTSSDGGYTLW